MPDPPTLVFIPGSWHKPLCYTKIITLLQNQNNIRCATVTLPSTSGDPNATFKQDVDAAIAVIKKEIDGGKDVVVIAHSYGGMIGNSAIRDFVALRHDDTDSSSSPERRRDASQGTVIGLILIASGFTLTGLSFMDPLFGIPPPSWRANKETGFAELVTPPSELFYHDLPEEEQEYWVSQLAPQGIRALFEGGEWAYAGWRDVKCWYVGTVGDRGLPVVMQRLQVGMARAMGGNITHREIQSSHSPFLSMPEETTEIIVEAVEAFTGKGALRQSGPLGGEENMKKKQIMVPGVRALQPITWFNFGIPQMLGWCIGKGLVTFYWVRGFWRRS